MRVIHRFKCYIIYIIGFTFTTTLIGRWALPEEAPIEVEFYNRDITVAADGKTEETIEVKRKILNEQGRNDFGTQAIIYNGNSEEIQILEAKAIFDGREYVVPESMIEKKPLASDTKGFDQLMQVLIAYPKCDIGTQLYLKYKLICLKQPLPNYFATEFHYGRDGYWGKSTVTLNSALPFNVLVNDPKNRLEVQQTNIALSIKLKEPLYESLTHEPTDGELEDKYQTWVKVSSIDSFEALAKSLAQSYESVLSRPLPETLSSIVNQTKTMVNEVDQINKVTSLLAENVRYMGDWRTIQGRYCPHNLEEIISTGVGDCKDLATCTVAILRKLSYEAYVATVVRGVAHVSPEKQLPSTDVFNHAIVKAIGKSGKIYWIDPTNLASMANGIFPDIANRKALVLNLVNPVYEKIPNIDPTHSRIELSEIITLSDQNDHLGVIGNIKLIGEEALSLTGATLKTSPRTLEESFIRSFCGELAPLSQKVLLPDLSSRIVKDLEIKYSYEQGSRTLLTNKGRGIALVPSFSDSFTNTSEEQICGILLGTPTTFSRKIFIPDMQAENSKVFDFNIKTPWVSIMRTCSEKKDGVEIEEHITIRQDFIKNEELKSTSYFEAKNKVKQYLRNTAIIVTPVTKNKEQQFLSKIVGK